MFWLYSVRSVVVAKYEMERQESHAKLNLSHHCELITLEYQKRYKDTYEMNLRLIKANMHETFLHFSKYILSEKGKIERSNCESKVRSISGMRVASHFPSS